MANKRLSEVVRETKAGTSIGNEWATVFPAIQLHLLKKLNLPPETLREVIEAEDHTHKLVGAMLFAQRGKSITAYQAHTIFKNMHALLPAYRARQKESKGDREYFDALNAGLPAAIDQLSKLRPVEEVILPLHFFETARKIQVHHVSQILGAKYPVYARAMNRVARVMQVRSKKR